VCTRPRCRKALFIVVEGIPIGVEVERSGFTSSCLFHFSFWALFLRTTADRCPRSGIVGWMFLALLWLAIAILER
jgi:hypothetical protein